MKKIVKKLKVGKLATMELNIPVVSYGEVKKGSPKLLILNGVHGNELSGLSVMDSLVTSLVDQKLKGQLSIITAANPLSQVMMTRETPVDWKDLNRAFPGSKEGTLSEQIAHSIYKEAKKYDYVIDMHTFDAKCPLIGIDINNGNDQTKETARDMLKALNPDITWQINTQSAQDVQYGGALCIVLAMQENIPSIAIELPEYYRLTAPMIKRATIGITNILKIIGMLKGTAKLSKLEVYERIRTHGTSSGLFLPAKKLLDEIKEGDIVGEILDLNTLDKSVLKAALSGPILTIMDREIIKPGDIVFSIGINKKVI